MLCVAAGRYSADWWWGGGGCRKVYAWSEAESQGEATSWHIYCGCWWYIGWYKISCSWRWNAAFSTCYCPQHRYSHWWSYMTTFRILTSMVIWWLIMLTQRLASHQVFNITVTGWLRLEDQNVFLEEASVLCLICIKFWNNDKRSVLHSGFG